MGFGPETPVPKTITASITATGPLSLGARRTPRARPGLGSGKPPREPHIFISPPRFYIATPFLYRPEAARGGRGAAVLPHASSPHVTARFLPLPRKAPGVLAAARAPQIRAGPGRSAGHKAWAQ